MEPFHSFEGPERKKRLGGIASVAEVEENVERLPIGGFVGWAAPECGTSLGDAVLCYPQNGNEQEPKNYNGIQTFTGIAPIEAVTTGSECFIRGYDFEAEAERALEARMDRAIEKTIDTWAFGDSTARQTLPHLDAVALLDETADRDYEGRPVIFINRWDAFALRSAKAIFGDKDGNLWTVNGTPVVSSSSITPDFMFATGAVKILKSPVVTTRTISHITNREQALAEQAFAVLVDCEFLIGVNISASE